MPVSKQTRRARHEQAESPTMQRGNPSSSEGRIGTQQFRNITGKGLVHMVRDETGWKELGSSIKNTNQGDKVARTISSTVSAGASATSSVGGGGSADVHGNLSNLGQDDHAQYVHLSNVRTISGNHVFSGAPQFNNINVDGGDIASGTTINKSPVITLAGDLGGNATLTNLGNATLTATIQPNSVALATDTTGNYMTNVTGNSQVSVSHSQGEGSTAALSIANDSIGDTQLAYNTGQHLTSSSAVTFATVDTGQGANELYDMNQNVLTTSSPQFSNMTFGEYSNPDYSNGEIGTSTFVSGFVGTGWKMSKSGNEYNLETNNMTIRGTLSVYELLIQQIRATNGAIFVTSCAKVDSWDNSNSQITFEDPSNNNICPFAVNDIIMMQRIQPGSLAAADGTESGLTQIIKKVVYKVTAINGKIATVTSSGVGYTNSSTPANGDDFVRIGNTTDTARQGVIYLTSDDSEAPFIDIKANIDSYSDWTGSTPKVRLGKLDGITDTNAGLSGSQSELYGLYSDSVHLKGHIFATSGKIGGISMDSNKIYTGTGTYNNSNTGFYIDSSSNFSLGNKLAWNNSTLSIDGTVVIGSTAASTIESNANSANQDSTSTIRSGTTKANVGLGNVDNDSTSSIRAVGAATSGTVGGWAITSDAITGSSIVMSSTGNIAVANGYSLNNDGSASFADGGITFAQNGDITSNTFLIERTRLFGAGEDGAVSLQVGGNSGSSNQDSWYGVNNAEGTRVLLNQGAVSGSNAHWYLSGDVYSTNFTIASGVTLFTNGYRIFCSGTFSNSGTVQNLGSGGTNGGEGDASGGVGGGGAGGAGGLGGSLASGTSGSAGSAGGSGGLYGANGGAGGGGGGTGGIILISARYISNSGTIRANGGNGGNGGAGAGV